MLSTSMDSRTTNAETTAEAVRASPYPPLRVLIADDGAVFLEQLGKWLSAHPGFQIVGKAYSGMEAVHQSGVLRPDLVIMDVAIPVINGVEAAARIKGGGRSPVVIFISFFDFQDAYHHSGQNADAFIRKDALYEELLPTVARLFPTWREQSQGGFSTEERRPYGV
jgi:response regulator NasT